MNSLMNDTARNAILFIITLLLLIGLSYCFTHNKIRNIDVSLFDETYYLYNGIQIDQQGLPNPDISPLYSLWYRLLNIIEKDNLDLYFLNIYTIHCLIGILIFSLLKNKHISYEVSLIFAILSMLLRVNNWVTPKPFHLVVIIILILLIIIDRLSGVQAKLILVTIGSLLICYIRPEFFFLFIFLLFLTILCLIVRPDHWVIVKRPSYFVALIAFSLVMIGIFGIPAISDPEHRSRLAFGQHFAANWVVWNNSDLNPWTEWPQILNRTFGRSYGYFWINNIGAVLKHVLTNIKTMSWALLRLVSVSIVKNTSCFGQIVEGLILTTLTITLIIYSFFRINISKINFNILFSLIVMGLFCLISFFDILVIFPRDHYFVVPIFLCIISFAAFLDMAFSVRIKKLILLGSIVLMLLTVISDKKTTNFKFGIENIDTIKHIRNLDIEENVNIMESGGGIWIYLGDNYRGVPTKFKDTNFSDFVGYQGINMILATPDVYENEVFASDPEWNEFIRAPEKWDFRKLEIPNTRNDLFVQSSLIH